MKIYPNIQYVPFQLEEVIANPRSYVTRLCEVLILECDEYYIE